ncbi:MAG: Holliday junction branch migration DNA helicase RuvB [Deltaproteobacteria bacterium]|nr:Holliday junction branch migration DNA helicase RuvB [Deltaproteobacteria bacterium]
MTKQEELDGERAITAQRVTGDEYADATLRPKRFEDYVGQVRLVDNLKVMVEAAKLRKEPVDHLLFAGPPGLGKTSLAHIIAHEMGVAIHVTSGPAIEKKGDLAGILTNLQPHEVLFIDEIHRLSAAVEENLYPAMEDFRFDVVIGEGPHARTMTLPLPRFTLVGATTRTGLLSSPLRDRFGHVARLDFYSPEDLIRIVTRSARVLHVELDPKGAEEISHRSRGTPRIANRLLRRLRDFAQIIGDGRITPELAKEALERLEVDKNGFDEMDRRFLLALIDRFGGGPVGLDTIAAAIGEEPTTIEAVIEPFLIKEGFVARTPRGRVATPSAYKHFGRPIIA